MKAVILCAGIGSRLKSYTENKPKCLVEIKDKPILSYQVDALIELGVEDIVLVTGYLEEKIRDYCYDKYPQKFIYVLNEDYKTTNSLYSLFLAKQYLEGEEFILFNADLVFDKNLLDLLLNDPRETATLVDSNVELQDGEMNVVVKENRVVEFSKEIPKESADALSLQITKFSAGDSNLLFKRAEELLSNGESATAFPAKAYDIILSKSSMYPVYRNGGKWYEIDTVDDLLYCMEEMDNDEEY